MNLRRQTRILIDFCSPFTMRKTFHRESTIFLFTIIFTLLCYSNSFVFQLPKAALYRGILAQSTTVLWSTNEGKTSTLQALIEEQRRAELMEAALFLSKDSKLLKIQLVGQARLYNAKKEPVPCAVLSVSTRRESTKSRPCLMIPFNSNQLKLLEFAVYDQPQSKSVLLGLNSLLVNRDGALFDNLPWASWTIETKRCGRPLSKYRNRDAAGNLIDPKYHLGKRDAYNRFLGKDWQGKSLAIGNLALRLKYALQRQNETLIEDSDSVSLAQRILQLKIKEQEMDLAECDYELAVARQNDLEGVALLEQRRSKLIEQLEATKVSFRQLISKDKDAEKSRDRGLVAILDEIAEWTTEYGAKAAPYRGATGYAPILDSLDDVEQSFSSYSSPYCLMKEILKDQLNAEVVGAVLENTSLLTGNTVVGGALILRRIPARKSLSIAGETLEVEDEVETFGNDVKGGETVVVDCDADEAIGMAVACGVRIRVESALWERASLMAAPLPVDVEIEESVRTALPFWNENDSELSVLIEGQALNESLTERPLPLRIPRTTVSFFDALFMKRRGSSSAVFPTDNPIKSLPEYDALSNDDKALTLLQLSSFDGRLPRPRALRQDPTALDDLLLPLIDESVRRQYLIRDAERRGDVELAQQLKVLQSKRQLAREKADQAREAGMDDMAATWEQEAAFQESLRADVTQDEGSYSRFLDRDDWYERVRSKQARKLDKRKFGTLLDGIE